MLIKDYKEWSSKEYEENKFELINNTTTEVDSIIIHHTYIPDSKYIEKYGFKYTLQIIQKSHINRGFDDIGYHYLIDLYGNIYKGRENIHKGAHCVPNSGKLGVALIIDGNNEDMTISMYDSLLLLLTKLVLEYNLNPINDIYGHKDFNNTECPGSNIYKIIKLLKKRIKESI